MPDTIVNGYYVSRPTNRRPGAKAIVSCNGGPGEYVIDGSATRTCTEDADGKRATWLPGDEPKCKSLIF